MAALSLGITLMLAACSLIDDQAVVPDESEPAAAVAADESDAEASAGSPGAEHPSPPSDAEQVRVRWILDGDSLEIAAAHDGDIDRDEIRLIGINAPESGECLSDASRDRLIELIKGSSVTIAGDWRDDFGRRLVYLWHDDQLVNLSQIETGHAVARSAFGHDHEPAFDAAEANARRTGQGLWGPACTARGADAESAATGPALSGSVTEGDDGAERSGIGIESVVYDAEGRDDENPNGEWIVITNFGGPPAPLAGWILRDESTRHRYEFPAIEIASGELVRVHSGCAPDGFDTDADTDGSGVTELHWCADGPVWSNSGDTAFLLAPDGTTADSQSWESVYDE